MLRICIQADLAFHIWFEPGAPEDEATVAQKARLKEPPLLKSWKIQGFVQRRGILAGLVGSSLMKTPWRISEESYMWLSSLKRNECQFMHY